MVPAAGSAKWLNRALDRPRDQERRVLQHRTRADRGWKGLRAMFATRVDEEEPQLLTQEIACDTVATIEDALAVIRQGVARACLAFSGPPPLKGEQP